MEKIDIQGKAYITVNERIKEFRTNTKYADYKLITGIYSIDTEFVIFKATILNAKNEIVATGFSREKDGDGFINKTSFVENAETSAWGRALANLGIGVDTSIASYEEVENAKLNQDKPKREYTNKPNPALPKKPPSKEIRGENDPCPLCDAPVEFKGWKDPKTDQIKYYWKCSKCGERGWNIRTKAAQPEEQIIPF